MNSSQHPSSRRRFLQITGVATVGAAVLPGLAATGRPNASRKTAWTWTGHVLGAESTISLYGLPDDKASRLTRSCFQELRRLEKLFSLYEPDSAVCRLNRQGYLDDPPVELVRLLSEADRVARITGGRFDVTIQSLWSALSEHAQKSQGHPLPARPLEELLDRVDHTRLKVSTKRIEFTQPGMAITLNGIAQGWITDRITETLRKGGVTSTLINIGEYRALGQHPDRRPWQLGVRGANGPEDLVDVVPLRHEALAVSGGHGHPFSQKQNHLLHPVTGKSPSPDRIIAIVAPTATEADALSTACAVVDDEEAHGLAKACDVELRIYRS